MACQSEPALALPSRLCFVHVGPQDKPMPEFCLAYPHQMPGDLRVADDTTWRAVLALTRDVAPELVAQQPGSYRVSADRDWQAHLVGPAVMRSLAAVLVDAAQRQGSAAPAQIEQLQRRLGPA